MNEFPWIKSHVELLLQAEWSACRVFQDGDGDYPFRRGTAACWVTVLDDDPVMVRVWAHAAHDVKPSAKLLRELNDIQSRALSAAVMLSGSTVIVQQTISPVGLTQPVLAQAMTAVGGVAEDIGLLLAAMYEGRTPFPVEAESDKETSE